jgi:hypothetical protein
MYMEGARTVPQHNLRAGNPVHSELSLGNVENALLEAHTSVNSDTPPSRRGGAATLNVKRRRC